MDMLLYIPAPIFADATITVKVHRKPCSEGLSQASFLKKVILMGLNVGYARRVIHGILHRVFHLCFGRFGPPATAGKPKHQNST